MSELNAHRVFVDLAHINRARLLRRDRGPRSQPAAARHRTPASPACIRTGATSTTRSYARSPIPAASIGVMYHGGLSRRVVLDGGRAAAIVDHLAHIVDTVGEDHAALGSDWDGAIITPRDMPTCLELPRLVQS